MGVELTEKIMFSSLKLFQNESKNVSKFANHKEVTNQAEITKPAEIKTPTTSAVDKTGFTMRKTRNSGKSFNQHLLKVAVGGITLTYVCFKLLQWSRQSFTSNGAGLRDWRKQDNEQLLKDLEKDWAVMQKEVDRKAAERKRIADEQKAWEEKQLQASLSEKK